MFRPSFAHLALLLQVPGPAIEERMAAEKGSALTRAELAILEQRVAAANVWLEDFAPESARLAVAYDAPPPAITELDAAQRDFLASLEEAASATPPVSGESWQALVFQVARDRDLPAGQAFGALYRAFLGRSNGPRAGWLLASLPI
jgi:lysyl-tRNA synthetase class 1